MSWVIYICAEHIESMGCSVHLLPRLAFKKIKSETNQ